MYRKSAIAAALFFITASSNLQALGLELLRRVDGAQDLVIDVFGGHYLGDHLGDEWLRHMAVRAIRSGNIY